MVLVGALYLVLREADGQLTTDSELDMIPKQKPLENDRESYMKLKLSSRGSGATSALVEMDGVED